jgi:hypothetical protein
VLARTTVRADAAGPVDRRSHDYARYAASTAFAALETVIGKILKKADCQGRSNAARWKSTAEPAPRVGGYERNLMVCRLPAFAAASMVSTISATR